EWEGALAVGYGHFEVYGFHTLEALQVMAERRRGGETGVKAGQGLEGKDAWGGGGGGRWDRRLRAGGPGRGAGGGPGPGGGGGGPPWSRTATGCGRRPTCRRGTCASSPSPAGPGAPGRPGPAGTSCPSRSATTSASWPATSPA